MTEPTHKQSRRNAARPTPDAGLNGALPVIASPFPIDLIHNPSAVRTLKDGEVISIQLGSTEQIEAGARSFAGCVLKLDATIPGFPRKRLPPLHLFSDADFSALERQLGLGDMTAALDPGKHFKTLAWWDKSAGHNSKGAIELRLESIASGAPPNVWRATGKELKALLSAVVHEAQHAAGAGEFLAYRRQNDFDVKAGIAERIKSSELMSWIHRSYPDDVVAAAQAEFYKYCDARKNTASVKNYARFLRREEKAARKRS